MDIRERSTPFKRIIHFQSSLHDSNAEKYFNFYQQQIFNFKQIATSNPYRWSHTTPSRPNICQSLCVTTDPTALDASLTAHVKYIICIKSAW